jgi:hypothetical protein
VELGVEADFGFGVVVYPDPFIEFKLWIDGLMGLYYK